MKESDISSNVERDFVFKYVVFDFRDKGISFIVLLSLFVDNMEPCHASEISNPSHRFDLRVMLSEYNIRLVHQWLELQRSSVAIIPASLPNNPRNHSHDPM